MNYPTHKPKVLWCLNCYAWSAQVASFRMTMHRSIVFSLFLFRIRESVYGNELSRYFEMCAWRCLVLTRYLICVSKWSGELMTRMESRYSMGLQEWFGICVIPPLIVLHPMCGDVYVCILTFISWKPWALLIHSACYSQKLVSEVFQHMWFTPVKDRDNDKLMRRVLNITTVISAIKDSSYEFMEQLMKHVSI